MMLDSDSGLVDGIKARNKGFYGLDSFCCGNTSLGSNYAKGRYGEGREIAAASMDKFKKI